MVICTRFDREIGRKPGTGEGKVRSVPLRCEERGGRGLCTDKGSVLWKYRMLPQRSLYKYLAGMDLTRRVYCVTIDESSRTDDRSRASG